MNLEERWANLRKLGEKVHEAHCRASDIQKEHSKMGARLTDAKNALYVVRKEFDKAVVDLRDECSGVVEWDNPGSEE